jgi:outer membrane immunogenic protein
VKKRLLVGAAVGALVGIGPAIAQSPTAAATYGWTGLYGGLNFGYSWGNGGVTYNEPAFASIPGPISFSGPNDLDGAIGGAQIGYNWEINNAWVAGLEADIQAASEAANGSFAFGSSDTEGIAGQLSSQILWFGTVRGRVGWLWNPTTMLYATGGLAYGDVNVSGSVKSTLGGIGNIPNGSWNFNQSALNTGWTVGGGIEAAVWNSPYVTWKIEYLYVNLGSISGGGFDIAGHPYTFNASFTDNIFRVGLNWKLSP